MDLEGMQELQKIDLLRDAALGALEAATAQIGPPPFMEALDAEIEAQSESARQADLRLREARAQVETAERRIEATDKRLYGGAESDHRVLQELQADLYSQRQEVVPMRDAALAAERAREAAVEAEQWLRNLRSAAESNWERRQAELTEAKAKAEVETAALTVQVEAQRQRLDGEDLATYDSYRRRRPRVVAPVAGGVCGECRLSLPTMVITRARRAVRPVECPSCGCLVRVS